MINSTLDGGGCRVTTRRMNNGSRDRPDPGLERQISSCVIPRPLQCYVVDDRKRPIHRGTRGRQKIRSVPFFGISLLASGQRELVRASMGRLVPAQR